MLVLVHETPYRMRFNDPAMKHNANWGTLLVETAYSVPGVTSAETNRLTGSLIVHHSGSAPQRDAILQRLGAQTAITISQDPQMSGAASRPFSLDGAIEALGNAVMQRIIDRAFHAVAAAIL